MTKSLHLEVKLSWNLLMIIVIGKAMMTMPLNTTREPIIRPEITKLNYCSRFYHILMMVI